MIQFMGRQPPAIESVSCRHTAPVFGKPMGPRVTTKRFTSGRSYLTGMVSQTPNSLGLLANSVSKGLDQEPVIDLWS